MRKPTRRRPRKPSPAKLREALTEQEQARLTVDEERLRWSNFFPASLAPITRRQEALKTNPVVVNLPPLPPLTLRLGEWVGRDVLKSWAGFRAKRGSKGVVAINISRPVKDNDDANPVPPAKEMVAAYAHLKEHEVEVRDAIVAAFRAYLSDALIRAYGPENEHLEEVKDLKRMMTIRSVHPMPVAKKSMSYVGLFFHCTWDEEHAAGALLHGSRVVKVGDNEAAGDEFAATEDGGKRLRPWRW